MRVAHSPDERVMLCACIPCVVFAISRPNRRPGLLRCRIPSLQCTSSCSTPPVRFPALDVQLSRSDIMEKATHISLVGDVVKRAGNGNSEED